MPRPDGVKNGHDSLLGTSKRSTQLKRKGERLTLVGGVDLLDVVEATGGQPVQNPLDEQLRSRRPGRDFGCLCLHPDHHAVKG